MHIAKAGGSALHAAFGRAFDMEDPPHYLDRSSFGSYDDFSSWSPQACKRMIFLPDSEGLDRDARYVAGHISLATIRDNLPDAQIVTVLREPISRLLSSWVFGRAAYDVDPDDQGSWGQQLASISLADLLSSPHLAPLIDNRATRTLLSPHPLIPEDGFIAPDHDDELIKQALDRLESLSAVGVYEDKNYISHFEKFLETDLSLERINETTYVAKNLSALHDDINSKTFGLLENRCRIDTKIWEEYCRQYDVDFNRVRTTNLLRNIARFSLVLSGANALQRERDHLKQKVHAMEQALIAFAPLNQERNALARKVRELEEALAAAPLAKP